MKVKINIFTLLVILSFSSFLIVNAQEGILGKQVSVKSENKTIPEILRIIEKSDNIKFVYSNNIIPKNYRVNINVKNHELNKVLKSILGSTSLGWKELDEHIIIYKLKEKKETEAVKKKSPNLVNVINVYDTIVSVKYDTITNFVYDTLMVIQHDTVVHEIYEYKKQVVKHLNIGLAYSSGVYINEPEILLESNSDNYYKKETLTSAQNIYALYTYKRNRLFVGTGVGLKQHNLKTDYSNPEYNSLYKDTTVYIEQEYPEYRMEGDEVVWYLNTRFYDSTYSKVYDSTLSVKESSKEKRINYLSIPINIGYSFFQKKNTSLYVNTGGTVNILLSEKQNNILNSDKFQTTEYNKIFFRYYWGIGAEYLIKSKLTLSIAIQYNIQINSKYKNVKSEGNTIQGLDISFGIGYRLK